MHRYLNQILSSQFEASLCMMQHCIKACPPKHWDGKIAKRFEVVSAQKIDDRWFLKQMRVEEMKPGTNKVQARTYLEIKR